VFTKGWHRDYREDMPKHIRWPIFATGHLGFAGRGAAFLALAVLFLKDASSGDESDAPHESSMVANALTQLNSKGLRALLFIVGFLLVVYGLFAVLSAMYARVFPTPAPTRRIPLPKKCLDAHHEAEEEETVDDVEARGVGFDQDPIGVVVAAAPAPGWSPGSPTAVHGSPAGPADDETASGIISSPVEITPALARVMARTETAMMLHSAGTSAGGTSGNFIGGPGSCGDSSGGGGGGHGRSSLFGFSKKKKAGSKAESGSSLGHKREGSQPWLRQVIEENEVVDVV
jgi:hypothetical protein